MSDTFMFLFSLLPDTLLHCLSCVHLLVLHRQLLADTLLMDRLTMQNAGKTPTTLIRQKKKKNFQLATAQSDTIFYLFISDVDLICSPILSTFPVLLDQTDLLDALRVRNGGTVVTLVYCHQIRCSYFLSKHNHSFK